MRDRRFAGIADFKDLERLHTFRCRKLHFIAFVRLDKNAGNRADPGNIAMLRIHLVDADDADCVLFAKVIGIGHGRAEENLIRIPPPDIHHLGGLNTLIEEADKITKAQLARGADFESGNVFKRAKSMLPILIPLFVNSFRRADELAMAMESRCYHGGEGRTRMRVLKFHMGDLAAVIIFAAFIAAVALAQTFLPAVKLF